MDKYISHKRIYYLCALLTCIYPCFFEFIPVVFGLIFPIVSLIIIIFINLNNIQNISITSKLNWEILILVGLVVLGLLSGNCTSRVFYTLISFIEYIVLSAIDDWETPFFDVLFLLTFVHVVATIVLYIFPDLYQPYVKPFFPDSIYAKDYRSGITSQHSWNAMYISICMLISVSKVLCDKRKLKKNRYLFLITSILALWALVLTTKRAHLTFGIIGSASMVVLARNKNRGFRFLVLLIIAFIALSVFQNIALQDSRLAIVIERFQQDDGDTAGFTSGRIFLWNYALQLWGQSPLFGNGWGSFFYLWYNGDTSVGAHNIYLQLLAETGLLGLITYFALLVDYLLMAKEAIKREQKIPATIYCPFVFSIGYMVFMLFDGLVGNGLYDPPQVLALAISLAFVKKAYNFAKLGKLNEGRSSCGV